MKPRIRTIKPESHTDEDLWDLEQETGLPIFRAFTGLWCHADREGRFEWRPRPLKAGILPYWDGDFSRVLDALEGAGFIQSYEVDGTKYGLIPSFLRHQAINQREARSDLPAPPSTMDHILPRSCGLSTSHVHAHADTETHVGNRTEGKGTRTEGKGMELRDADARHDDATTRNHLETTTAALMRGSSENLRRTDDPLRELRNFEAALAVPVKRRALLLVENPAFRAQDWCSPHQWPEVLQLAADFSSALGLPDPRLSRYDIDSGVRAMVQLLATFETEELERAVVAAKKDDWLKSRSSGLASFSVEVVRRLLAPRRNQRNFNNSKRQPDYPGEKGFSAAALFAEDAENQEQSA